MAGASQWKEAKEARRPMQAAIVGTVQPCEVVASLMLEGVGAAEGAAEVVGTGVVGVAMVGAEVVGKEVVGVDVVREVVGAAVVGEVVGAGVVGDVVGASVGIT